MLIVVGVHGIEDVIIDMDIDLITEIGKTIEIININMKNKFVIDKWFFGEYQKEKNEYSMKIKLIDSNKTLLSTIDVMITSDLPWYYKDDLANFLETNHGALLCNLESFDKKKGYGKSIMLKAIKESNLNDVYSIISFDNIPSLNLHMKMGFKIVELKTYRYILKYTKKIKP